MKTYDPACDKFAPAGGRKRKLIAELAVQETEKMTEITLISLRALYDISRQTRSESYTSARDKAKRALDKIERLMK